MEGLSDARRLTLCCYLTNSIRFFSLFPPRASRSSAELAVRLALCSLATRLKEGIPLLLPQYVGQPVRAAQEASGNRHPG